MAFEIAKTIVSARTPVPTAGTRVRLSTTPVAIFRIDISGDTGNAQEVVIGDKNVVAARGSQKGTVLMPGNVPITIYISDLNKLYVDARSNGDAATYTYHRHH